MKSFMLEVLITAVNRLLIIAAIGAVAWIFGFIAQIFHIAYHGS